ncbi:MAG: M28 family peptidase [Lentisphaeria bacterium]|nr:M28 family peptidase [Lentisphaeria bacterium]
MKLKGKTNWKRLSTLSLSIVAIPLVVIWYYFTVPFTGETPTVYHVHVDESDLRRHVKYLSEECYPRSFEKLENLTKSAQYIYDEFAKYNPQSIFKQSYYINRANYENVVARFGDPTAKKLIIGAHYDTCNNTPGADDNASGVAGLIALAKLFNETSPPFQVELVAYSNEEPPFFGTNNMGSYVHAKSVANEKDNLLGMIALEMIGFYSSEPGSQGYPSPVMYMFYPDKGNFIATVGRVGDRKLVSKTKRLMTGASGIPVEGIAAPSIIPGIDYSDHRNYWKFDIPAVMVTDTSFYRNHHYHQLTDVSQTLDYGRMAQTIESVYHVVQNWYL